MSRLIVLSNRVKMPDNNPMAGGLAVALSELLTISSGVWMGWNGDILDAPTYNYSEDTLDSFSICKKTGLIPSRLSNVNLPVTYITTPLSAKQYQHYYCGFANNVLWPMLHEQIDLIVQSPDDFESYQSVNELFAKQLKQIIGPSDVIWVHDYHFLSVAYYCRQLGITNRIGFFLHIPFAPLKFWQRLDTSPELIKHLVHYDVLGTQTQQDKQNCLHVINHYLKPYIIKNDLNDFDLNIDNTLNSINRQHHESTQSAYLTFNLGLEHLHHLVIKAYPIGVNVTKIQQQVADLSELFSKKSVAKSFKPKEIKSSNQQIIAVDRIDYSKGLLQRFSAYSTFLQQYPAYQQQLKLLQIACPSRLDLPTYKQLYKNVRLTVNNINKDFISSSSKTTQPISKHQEFTNDSFHSVDYPNIWQPINYTESVLSHKTLMKAFWHSDIGWVNSLKDGMNLVAKEYVAAQNPENPGVLLLSRYAGASEQMQATVIVDPLEPSNIITGLKKALTMPLKERKERHQILLDGLKKNSLMSWQQDFLDDLYQVF